MEDEKQVPFEFPDDAFPNSPESGHSQALNLAERRFDGAEQKRRRKPDALQGVPGNALTKRREVELYIRKLRHGQVRGAGASRPVMLS